MENIARVHSRFCDVLAIRTFDQRGDQRLRDDCGWS